MFPIVIALPAASELLIAGGIALATFIGLKWALPAVQGKISWEGLIAYVSRSVVDPLENTFNNVRKAYEYLVTDTINCLEWIRKTCIMTDHRISVVKASVTDYLKTFIQTNVLTLDTRITTVKANIYQNINYQVDLVDTRISAVKTSIYQNIIYQVNLVDTRISAVKTSIYQNISYQVNLVDTRITTTKQAIYQAIIYQVNLVDTRISAVKTSIYQNISYQVNLVDTRITNLTNAFKTEKDYIDNFRKFTKTSDVSEITALYNVQILALGWLPLEITKAYGNEIPGIIKGIKKGFVENV